MLANHTTDFSGDKILPPRSLLTPQAGSPWNGRLCATGKWAELGGAGPFLHRRWLGAAPSTFLSILRSSTAGLQPSLQLQHRPRLSVALAGTPHLCEQVERGAQLPGKWPEPERPPQWEGPGRQPLSQAGCEGGPCPQGRVYPSSLIPLHAQEAVLVPPEDRGLGRWEGKCRGGDW